MGKDEIHRAKAKPKAPVSNPDIITQSYRYRIAPTPEQAEYLDAALGASRFWHNQALNLVLERLKERHAALEAANGDAEAESVKAIVVPWSYKALTSAFDKDMRDEVAPWRKEVPCGSYLAGFEALATGLQAFTRNTRAGKKASMPDFKSKGRCSESVRFNCPRVLDDGRHIQLEERLGPLLTMERTRKIQRLLRRDPKARIKRATLTKNSPGRYQVSFVVERSARLKERTCANPGSVTGMDLGLKHLATLSTGEVIRNSRPLHRNLAKLARLQRGLERQRRMANPGNYDKKGWAKKGCRWKKTNRMLRRESELKRLHAKVAAQRKEQAHLLTSYIVRHYGIIGVESLNVAGMLKNKCLSRAISDVGWGMILSQLECKAAWRGRHLHAADRFYPSSKTCSCCGAVKAKLPLSERTYHCEHCGLVIDRDRNAALNLAHQAAEDARRSGVKVAGTCPETLNARGAPKPSRLMESGMMNREWPEAGPQSARADVVAAA